MPNFTTMMRNNMMPTGKNGVLPELFGVRRNVVTEYACLVYSPRSVVFFVNYVPLPIKLYN